MRYLHKSLHRGCAIFWGCLSFLVFPLHPSCLQADSTPPGAVTNLTALLPVDLNQLYLNWSSPGNDGTTGSLVAGSSYTLQYTTDPVYNSWSPTTAQPGHVFRVNIPTSGVNPGENEGFLLTGLQGGSTYFLRIWTSDQESNYSALSNGCTQEVLGAPAAVTDLTGLRTSNLGQLNLSWTYPENNWTTAPLPTGSSFTVQYTTDPLFSLWSPTATLPAYAYRVSIPTSGVNPPGAQGDLLSGLEGGTSYFLRIWTSNRLGHYSAISNGCTVQVPGFNVSWMPSASDYSVGAAWGDFNNDGSVDQLISNNGANRVYQNGGNGSFSLVWTSAESENTRAVAWGDFDRDGSLDQVAVNNGVIRVYRNVGGGNFSLVWTSSESFNSRAVSVGDFNNDGSLDILVGNYTEPSRVYRNNGDNTFSVAWVATLSDPTYAAAWADADNDGDLDFALGNYSQPKRLYRNNGDGTFTLVWSSPESDATTSLAWGDFDQDGYLDLLVGNAGQSKRIYRNNGNDTFTIAWNSAELDSTYAVAWGDYNNDGYLDVLVGNYNNVNRVYRNNNGDSTFPLAWSAASAMNTFGGAWADADNDGDLDLIFTNASQQNLLYRNNTVDAGIAQNAAPSAPVGFQSSYQFAVSIPTMTLRWDRGSYDGAASPDSLYYQLSVATEPMTLSADSKRITAPAKFVVSGAYGSPLLGDRLRPPASGGKHEVRLRLAANATYYWRVQTIDSGFARSPWSAEQTALTTGDSVRVSTADLNPGTLPQGVARALMRLDLWSSGADIPIRAMRVDRTTQSTALDGDIAEVGLYRDNGNGTFNALEDIKVSANNAAFINGSTNFLITPLQYITASTKTYFVTAQAAAAATIDRTLGVRIGDGTWIDVQGYASVQSNVFPAASSTATITDSANTFTVTPTTAGMPPANSTKGTSNVLFAKLMLQTDQGTTVLNGFRIVRSGSGSDGDVSELRVYKDNGNGLWDGVGTDTLISQPGAIFSSGVSTVSLASPETITNTVVFYFLTADISNSAVALNTVGLTLPSTHSVLVNTLSDTIQGGGFGFPMPSGLTTVNDPPNTLFVTGASTAPALSYQGGQSSMLRLHFRTDTGQALWTRLKVSLGAGETGSNVTAVKLYKDTGNGLFGIEDGSALTSAGFVSGSATLSFSTQTLTTGSTYFVVYDIDPSALSGSSVSARILLPADLTIATPNTTLSGSFPLLSSSTLINPTVDALTITPSDPGVPLQSVQGAQNVPILRLRMAMDANGASWTTLKVDRAGTSSSDSDVAAVKLYRDNGNGTFSASEEALLTSGSDRFTNGSVSLFLASPETMVASPAYKDYFLTFDLGADATLSKTVGLSIANTGYVTVLAPDTVSIANFPLSSTNTLTEITEYPDTVYISTESLAPSSVNPGSTGISLIKMKLWASFSQAPWTNLQLDQVGTLDYSRYKQIKLYQDTNGNGAFDSTQDTLLSTGVFPSAVLPVNLPIPSQYQTLTPSTKTLFLVVDLSTASEPLKTLGLRASLNSFFSITAPNTMDNSRFPFQSPLVPVSEPPSTITLSVSTGPPARVTQGDAGVLFLNLSAVMDSYSASWTALHLTRLGTGQDGDLSSIRIYRDNGNRTFSTAEDALITSGNDVFSNGAADLTFTSAQSISTTTAYYFVTGNVSLTALEGKTVGCSVPDSTALTVTAPDGATVVGSTNAQSALIAATTDTLQVSAYPMPLAGIQQGAEQAFEKLVLKTDANQAVWNQIVLQKTGTLSEGEVGNIKIYRDANSNGTLETAQDALVTPGLQAFSNGTAVIAVGASGTSGETIDTNDKTYFITLVLKSYAEVGKTIGVSMASGTAVSAVAPDQVTPIAWQSNLASVTDKPDTITMNPTVWIASGAAVYQGTETALARLKLAVNEDSAVLNSIQVKKLGTLSDQHITSVKLYKDDGDEQWSAAADTLMTSSTTLFSSGEAVLHLNSTAPLTTSGITLFVTYTLASEATVSDTFGLEVTSTSYFSVNGTDVVSSSNVPFATGLVRVKDGRIPTTPLVTDESDFTKDTRRLYFTWSSSVPIGSLADMQYAVGTATPGAANVVTWTSGTLANQALTLSLSLQHGQKYYVSVKSRSNFGYWSDVGTSDGITVDVQSPPAPAVPQSSVDGNVITLTWVPPSSSGLSGIGGYSVEEREASKPVWKTLAASQDVNAVPSRSWAAPPQRLGPEFPAGAFQSTSVQIRNRSPGTYLYRIRSVSGAGSLSDPSSEIRVNYALDQLASANVSNYPNPFDSRRENTTLTYSLKEDANVTLRFYDALGGKVREMGFSSGGEGGRAGVNLVTWDGSDSDGNKVSQGMYYVIIDAGSTFKSSSPLLIGVLH